MIQHPTESPVILEVIACTLDDAKEAERGGAHRLEVISHFELAGSQSSLAEVWIARGSRSIRNATTHVGRAAYQ